MDCPPVRQPCLPTLIAAQLLKVISPVAARVLQVLRDASVDLTLRYVGREVAGKDKPTHVLAKPLLHQIKTAIENGPVHHRLLDPECELARPLLVEEEVTEGQVDEAEGCVRVLPHVQYRMQSAQRLVQLLLL